VVGSTAGTLKVNTVGGETIAFANIAAGTQIDIAAKRVWATGTSATTLTALF
jgi:hypothetical protein